jgi:hypothetical protein
MDKSSPRYAAVEAEHLQNLASFVRRARRVREHSLVKDPALLNDTASGTMQVHATPNGVLSLVFVAPEEEQIESAAARVRPVILEKDRAFYSKALKAVRFLADPCSDELLGELAALRLAWKDATSRDCRRRTPSWRGRISMATPSTPMTTSCSGSGSASGFVLPRCLCVSFFS